MFCMEFPEISFIYWDFLEIQASQAFFCNSGEISWLSIAKYTQTEFLLFRTPPKMGTWRMKFRSHVMRRLLSGFFLARTFVNDYFWHVFFGQTPFKGRKYVVYMMGLGKNDPKFQEMIRINICRIYFRKCWSLMFLNSFTLQKENPAVFFFILRSFGTPISNHVVLLLMAEILHQLIGSLSHYL